MAANRLFVAQSTLDSWLEEGRVEVDGDVMTTRPEEHRFTLKTAIVFREELTGAGDPHSLVGKVKDLDEVVEIGGDYSAGSVILGDFAYDVVEGFVGAPVHEGAEVEDAVRGDSLVDAMRSAAGDSGKREGESEIMLLARLFITTRGE